MRLAEPLSSSCNAAMLPIVQICSAESNSRPKRQTAATPFAVSRAKGIEEAFFADFSEYFLPYPSIDVSIRCFRCVDRSQGEGEGPGREGEKGAKGNINN